jgi:hypothetical protein
LPLALTLTDDTGNRTERKRAMLESLAGLDVHDGEPVSADDLPRAVIAAPLGYTDESRQSFLASGLTRYVDGGHATEGQWSVDDHGRFTSFWPPSYRATYEVTWLVTDGQVAGLRFVDVRTGDRFDGHFDAHGKDAVPPS